MTGYTHRAEHSLRVTNYDSVFLFSKIYKEPLI
jgi:hypothetical protein